MKKFQIDTSEEQKLAMPTAFLRNSLTSKSSINQKLSEFNIKNTTNRSSSNIQLFQSKQQITPKTLQTQINPDTNKQLPIQKEIKTKQQEQSSLQINDQDKLSKELHRLQINQKDQIQQKNNKATILSPQEMAQALQNYHQYIQQNQSKQKNNLISQEMQINKIMYQSQSKAELRNQKNSNILNQFVTKVNQEDPTKYLKMKNEPKKYSQPRQTNQEMNRQIFKSSQSKDQGLKKSLLPGRQLSEAFISNTNKMTQQNLIHQKVTSITPQMRNYAQSKEENNFFESQNEEQNNLANIQGYYLHSSKNAFEKPFKEDYFSRLYRDHYYQTYQGIYFTQFFKPSDQNEFKNKKIQLKKKDIYKSYRYKITVVFDLDETLVHCNENTNFPNDVVLNIQITQTESINVL